MILLLPQPPIPKIEAVAYSAATYMWPLQSPSPRFRWIE